MYLSDRPFVRGIDVLSRSAVTLFADGDKCEAYDDCEYKYLKHISVCESCNRVGWDQVFDGVQNAGHLSCLDVGSCHFEFNTLTEMNQPRDDQSCQAGKCCGAQEKDHGTGCDLAGCAGISDTGDTYDNGTEDQWKDHHVQGVHVDTSDQTGHSEDWFKPSGQEKSCEDTQDQSCKDRTGNMLPVPGIKDFIYAFPPKINMYGMYNIGNTCRKLYHVKKEASTKPGQDCRFMYIFDGKGLFLDFCLTNTS